MPGRRKRSEDPYRRALLRRPEESRDRAGAREAAREDRATGPGEFAGTPDRRDGPARSPNGRPASPARRSCRDERRKAAWRLFQTLTALEANLHAFHEAVA